MAIRSLETTISTRSSCGVQCFNGNYTGRSTNTEWELSLLSQLERTKQGRSTQEERTEEVSVGEGDKTETTKATSTLNRVLPILPQIHSSSDCWELEKNQHKQPSGWQSVMEDMKEIDYTDNTGEANEGEEADEHVEEGTAD
jgi:hypothetical protein